jgi:hypothetical protein
VHLRKVKLGGDRLLRIPATTPGQVVPSPELLARLHAGPDLASVINAEYRDALPRGWQLSWGRVSPVPLLTDTSRLTQLTVRAFDEFERACAQLWARTSPLAPWQEVSDPSHRPWQNDPAPWSVRRLDVIIGQQGSIRVAENDEMPGGIVHAFFLDEAYGINQERWHHALQWLTAEGPLVYIVSHDWSEPYIHETEWLVGHLRRLGYPVDMVTTDDLHRLDIRTNGVYLNGSRVGTFWRLFPLFEMHGALEAIADLAREGHVRLVPEITTWGDKAWLGMFWQFNDFFGSVLSDDVFRLLCEVIPRSSLIVNGKFMRPYTLTDGTEVSEVDELFRLPETQRNAMILKVCGANRRSTRSLGVVMGRGNSRKRWTSLIQELLSLGEPVLLQEFFDPAPMQFPVASVLLGPTPRAEPDFTARFLLRPWSIGGQLISCTAFGVPQETRRLHGSTQGCEVPVDLDAS